MFNRKGQNTAEYAVLIALVIGAAIAMQTYVKRAWQGGVKFSVDKLRQNATSSRQYEPYYLESKYETTAAAYTGANADTEETKTGGGVERVFGSKTTTRSGKQTIKVTGAD
jgi:uncharacterized protein (UPF0333 family)